MPKSDNRRKKDKKQSRGGKLAKRRSTGSVNAPVPAHYTEGGDVSSHNPIDDGPIMGFGMSPNMAFHDYGLPERVSRQWVVDNTEPGEDLGVVPIPLEHRDGLFTHATYAPECSHDIDESCQCDDDETVQWTLTEYSG